MAGHSQFKNIMHRKGRQDAARAKIFAKLAREITVAAKSGLPDPAMNPRLRLAVQAARAENMPKENIERAIKKAQGNDTENFESVRYEGYGPGGVAIIVEALTDNRNRTGGAVRAAFTKYGGNLGSTGSVSHMFDRIGEVVYGAEVASADAMLRRRSRLAPRTSSQTRTAMSSRVPSKTWGAWRTPWRRDLVSPRRLRSSGAQYQHSDRRRSRSDGHEAHLRPRGR